jgi:hypothetical protein
VTIHITPDDLAKGHRVADLIGTHYAGRRITAVRIGGPRDLILCDGVDRWVDLAELDPRLFTATTPAIAGAPLAAGAA